MRWIERDGIRWLQAELPGGAAAFTTRQGGVSGPPCEGLNLGFASPDHAEAVLANRRRLMGALDAPAERVVSARQVHGAAVQAHAAPQPDPPFARAEPPGEAGPVADGQVVTGGAAMALVLVADCLPVALAGAGRGSGPAAVGMLHCGWRPMAAGVIERGVAMTGATAAAIGPGIGPCCYEVGDEVRAAFGFLEQPGRPLAGGRSLDLPEVAERLLRRAGVERIERSGLCTSCEEELLFSHRRDGGRTGRQAGIARLDRTAGRHA